MGPTTRHNFMKVTSPIKYKVSLENSSVGEIRTFPKRKAEHSPPKLRNLKRAALNEITNNGKTQKVKSIIKNNNKLTTISEKGLITQENDISSLASKSKNSYTGPTMRLPLHSRKNISRTSQTTNTTSQVKFTRKTASISEQKPIFPSKLTCLTKIVPPVTKTKSSGYVIKVQNNSKKVQTTINAFHDGSNLLEKHLRVTRPSTHRIKEEELKPIKITSKTIQDLGRQIENEQRPVRRSSTRLRAREALEKLAKKEESTLEVVEVKEEKEFRVTRSSTRLSLSRKSLTADKTAESNSLYISALEDVASSTQKEIEQTFKDGKNIFDELSEFDKELLHDPYQVSLYAAEIFVYLKEREAHFVMSDYMPKFHDKFNEEMRAILIDWMVEVQENFELNHETLYLSVKILDMHMDKVLKIEKEMLQLVAITSLFIASKYDESLTPALEDFVYICDGAYTQSNILTMERTLLESVNFELSFPISYSFLRRYARCVRVQMPLLTLARFILELSLMEYATITLSDSKLAAAALYLAFRMVNHDSWTDSLTYYTGYKLGDLKDIVLLLNGMLHKPESAKLMSIKSKYSNEVFFKVALTPKITDDALIKSMNLHC